MVLPSIITLLYYVLRLKDNIFCNFFFFAIFSIDKTKSLSVPKYCSFKTAASHYLELIKLPKEHNFFVTVI